MSSLESEIEAIFWVGVKVRSHVRCQGRLLCRVLESSFELRVEIESKVKCQVWVYILNQSLSSSAEVEYWNWSPIQKLILVVGFWFESWSQIKILGQFWFRNWGRVLGQDLRLSLVLDVGIRFTFQSRVHGRMSTWTPFQPKLFENLIILFHMHYFHEPQRQIINNIKYHNFENKIKNQ